MPIPALLAAAGTSVLPGLLGSLFGDPRKKLMREANQMLSPERLQALTQQLYQMFLGSPAFAQGQGTIAAGANQASNQVAQNLAARGLGTTGTGAIMSSLTPSLVGSQLAGLRTAGWNQAQGAAQQQIMARLKAMFDAAGMELPASLGQQLLGAGSGSLGKWLENWKSQQPPGTPGR